jgi:hypothetical protein
MGYSIAWDTVPDGLPYRKRGGRAGRTGACRNRMLFRPSQRRSSRRSANHHSEWLGRPVGTPSRRHPYALYIEPARVLVGGRLLGPGQGTGAPEQSAASASSASTHCAVNHLSTPIRIKPTQKKWSSAKSAARSVHLPDHLVQDQIRGEADCGSCLAARRSPARQSWIGAVPATRSRKRVRFASSSCAARKKVPPVRPKHRAIVGSNRGSGTSGGL